MCARVKVGVCLPKLLCCNTELPILPGWQGRMSSTGRSERRRPNQSLGAFLLFRPSFQGLF